MSPIETAPAEGDRGAAGRARCIEHLDAPAVAHCTICAGAICDACTRQTFAGLMCPACARRDQRRRGLRTALIAGGFVTFVVGFLFGPLALIPGAATFALAYWR